MSVVIDGDGDGGSGSGNGGLPQILAAVGCLVSVDGGGVGGVDGVGVVVRGDGGVGARV